MKLIQCRFSSGQRVPLLVQDGLATPLPKLVPFIYVQLKLRHRAYNHGFQVVIATHDALQARYFLRKLQNDGIEANIWTLVPTENGVTAQAGSWKQRIQ